VELLEREQPLALLSDAHSQSRRGSGRIVVVRGEAGVGKTSLVRAFLDQTPGRSLTGRCDDASIPAVLGPFHELFNQAGIDVGPSDAEGARSEIRPVLEGSSCAVIEDLHWADEATLDLVAHVAYRISGWDALLILTLRPSQDPHVARCLAQMPNEHTETIDLNPLSEVSVRAMAAAAGRDGTGVFEQTTGNPFLVAELLADGLDGIPARVTNASVARLGRLSGGAGDLVRLLSVLPAGATWELMEWLELDGDIAMLDELERHGWLDPSAPRITFRHELIRRAIEGSLSQVRRRRLNRRVLDALTPDEANAAAIAHHAELAGDHGRFIEYAIVAAREFARAGAHRDALVHLERAAPHADLLPPEDRARFAEALGSELMTANRPSDARDALRDASNRWLSLGDLDAAARTLATSSTATWQLGAPHRQIEELDQAAALVDGTEHRYRAFRIRMTIAQCVGMLSRWPEALAIAEDAPSEAATLGPEALCVALGLRGNARRILGDKAAGRADHDRSIELSMGLDEQRIATISYINRVAASLGTLDLDHIDSEVDAASRHLAAIQYDSGQFSLDGHRSYLMMLRGEWDDAIDLTDRISGRVAEAVHRIRPNLVEGVIRVRRGDDTGLDLVRSAHGAAEGTHDIQRLGPTVVALAELQWLGKLDESETIRHVAELARSSGHLRFAAELALWCRRLSLDATAVPDRGPAPILAELAGDRACADDEWRRLGCLYHSILCRGFADDERSLRSAIADASKLGAKVTADRLRARLRELGYAVPRGRGRATLANAGGLTNRQVDVVRLLAEGLTNQEVADRLFVSSKTVDHHVSAILTRLGVPDRKAAGEWAIAVGIASTR